MTKLPLRATKGAALSGTEGYMSLSAYSQFQTSDAFAWGLRLEYFNVNESEGDDTNVISPTLTGNYSVGNLTIRPELRLDSASEDIFWNIDADDTQGGLSTFTLAAVYSF